MWRGCGKRHGRKWTLGGALLLLAPEGLVIYAVQRDCKWSAQAGGNLRVNRSLYSLPYSAEMWENSHFTGLRPGRTQDEAGMEPAMSWSAHQLS